MKAKRLPGMCQDTSGSRECAEQFVSEFEQAVINQAKKNNRDVYKKGLAIAREWLRLITADEISQAEISAFIGVLYANKSRGSFIHDLTNHAYHWTRSTNLVIPPFEIFMTSPNPYLKSFDHSSPLQQANLLIRAFEENARNDPDYDAWSNGVAVTKRWLERKITDD